MALKGRTLAELFEARLLLEPALAALAAERATPAQLAAMRAALLPSPLRRFSPAAAPSGTAPSAAAPSGTAPSGTASSGDASSGDASSGDASPGDASPGDASSGIADQVAADLLLHRLIAEAAGNALLAAMLETLAALGRSSRALTAGRPGVRVPDRCGP